MTSAGAEEPGPNGREPRPSLGSLCGSSKPRLPEVCPVPQFLFPLQNQFQPPLKSTPMNSLLSTEPSCAARANFRHGKQIRELHAILNYSVLTEENRRIIKKEKKHANTVMKYYCSSYKIQCLLSGQQDRSAGRK